MADTRAWMKTVLTGWGMPSEIFGYTDSTKAIDHANERQGVSFQVQEDCSITHGTAFCATIVGTSPYMKLQLWPMSTTVDGQPDTSGTVLAETAEFQGSVQTGDWPLVKMLKTAFTSPYSATAGQVLCLILTHSSGTIDGSNHCTWKFRSGRAQYRAGIGAYLESYEADADAFTSSGTYQPLMTVTTDKTYDLGGYPMLAEAYYYFGTSGYRTANKITLPAADPGIEIHVNGIQVAANIANGTDQITVGAWDSDGDALITGNIIDTQQSTGQTAGDIGYYLGSSNIYFKDTLTMTSGNSYWIGIENTADSTNSLYCDFVIFDDWADECNRSWPMGSNIEGNIYLPFGGGWADNWAGSGSDKSRFLINPIISDIQGTSSGGGGGSSISGPSIGVIG